jgi:hypothetical protein
MDKIIGFLLLSASLIGGVALYFFVTGYFDGDTQVKLSEHGDEHREEYQIANSTARLTANPELTYRTTKKWFPYPEGSVFTKNGIQYREGEDGIILRKVYLEDEKKIYVFGKDSEKATVIIMFYAPCEENSEIETLERYGDRSPMILSCLHRETGTFLSIAIEIPYNTTIDYDFGGFRVNEDLTSWGLDPIIRVHTLKKARKIAPTIRHQPG